MTALFLGRFQGFHAGHAALVDVALAEGQKAIIALRDTPASAHNPFSLAERAALIRRVYPDAEQVQITSVPDFDELCYGRDVGYKVRRIELDSITEAISGTAARRKQRVGRLIWLTGNTGAGKTTLALALQPLTDAIILDGDAMRKSISVGLSLSREDRATHNCRVARLAQVLCAQGFNVIVAVIAPFLATRRAISAEIAPYWVYVQRSQATDAARPYEAGGYDLLVDADQMTPEEAAALVYRAVFA